MKKLLTLLLLVVLKNLNAQSPDLKTGISFNYGWTPGPNEINLTWDFFNVGGATANTFTIAYIASLDMNIDASDYLIEGVAYGGAVANAFATINYSVALDPDALPTGNYNFIVFIDYGNNVTESNETNNIVKFGSFNFTNVSVGIKNNPFSVSNLMVYPNPAKEILYISFNEDVSMPNGNYAFYDISGKQVLKGNIYKKMMENKIGINIDQITPGIYFLQIKNGETILETRKIRIE